METKRGKPIGKIPVFKFKAKEDDDNMEVVHRHLLLLLFPDPSDHTSNWILGLWLIKL